MKDQSETSQLRNFQNVRFFFFSLRFQEIYFLHRMPLILLKFKLGNQVA